MVWRSVVQTIFISSPAATAGNNMSDRENGEPNALEVLNVQSIFSAEPAPSFGATGSERSTVALPPILAEPEVVVMVIDSIVSSLKSDWLKSNAKVHQVPNCLNLKFTSEVDSEATAGVL